MPYENEFANVFGYSDFLNEDFIKERLNTYLATNRFDYIEELEPIKGSNLTPTDEELKYVFAVDGSLSSVFAEREGIEVGFIKVGIVIEKLKQIKKLEGERFIDSQKLKDSYTTYSLHGVLPGMGVVDSINNGIETPKDKFRKEVYENMNNIYIDPHSLYSNKSQLNLLDILLQLTSTKQLRVECTRCKQSLLLGVVPQRCPNCHQSTLYISDFFKLHEGYQPDGTNRMVYISCMSIFERITMCGLLYLATASPEPFKDIVFITDGPLASFDSKDLAGLILDFLQKLPVQPTLVGIEKTGTFANFANSPIVQEKLKAGELLMITDELIKNIRGGANTNSMGRNFYGRRFIYKTINGHKTFVFTAPPKHGTPYGDSVDMAYNFSDYPTLGNIIRMLEESQTNQFGVKTPAISSIAKANSVASIPENFGVELLEGLIDDNMTGV